MNSFNLSSRSAIKAAKISINEGIDLDIKSSLNTMLPKDEDLRIITYKT